MRHTYQYSYFAIIKAWHIIYLHRFYTRLNFDIIQCVLTNKKMTAPK